MSRHSEAAPSTSGRVTHPILSGRPAICAGVGARFKPSGLLGQATGYGAVPLPPPGWKPRKKDLASFDMLYDLPDLAAGAPLEAASAASRAPAEAGAAAGGAERGNVVSEAQPGAAKKRPWKAFVPPRPLDRAASAAAGASQDVTSMAEAAPEATMVSASYGDRLQPEVPESRQSWGAHGDEHGRPLNETVAEPFSQGRGSGGREQAGSASDSYARSLGEVHSSGGRNTLQFAAADPSPQRQQQQRRQQQASAEQDRSRLQESAGRLNEMPSAERAERHDQRVAGSSRLETPSKAEAVPGRARSGLTGSGQGTGGSTQRRRQLKRLYSDDPREDSLLHGTSSQAAELLDEVNLIIYMCRALLLTSHVL
jgi:hypothetical protein